MPCIGRSEHQPSSGPTLPGPASCTASPRLRPTWVEGLAAAQVGPGRQQAAGLARSEAPGGSGRKQQGRGQGQQTSFSPRACCRETGAGGRQAGDDRQSAATPAERCSPVGEVGAQQEAHAAALGGGKGQRPAGHRLVVAHNLRGGRWAVICFNACGHSVRGLQGGQLQQAPQQAPLALLRCVMVQPSPITSRRTWLGAMVEGSSRLHMPGRAGREARDARLVMHTNQKGCLFAPPTHTRH